MGSLVAENERFYGTSVAPKASERGVAFWRLAFEDHCKLCDTVQRRHGNAYEASHGPLASRACKVKNTVGGLGKTLEEGPSVELGATHYRRHALAPAHPKHAHDAG